MLIRRAPADVYEAFVDPEITSRFWFTSGSAPLREVGQVATWQWSWYGLELNAEVLEITPCTRLTLAWPVGRDLVVDVTFEAVSDEATFAQIRQTGFAADPDADHGSARRH